MMDADNKMQKVSVVMPTFNSAKTIERAIGSVIDQTYPLWQLVIVDDCSTDETLTTIQPYLDQFPYQIALIRSKSNGGPSKARNIGFAACDGDWIAVLDSDDAWREDRLRLLLTRSEGTDFSAVCDNLRGFDDSTGQLGSSLFFKLPEQLDIQAAVAPYFSGDYNLGYLKPIFRRSFVEKNCLSYDETLRTGEDLLFLLQILLSGGEVGCINESSYMYTTPVGASKKRLSRSTKTSPRDVEIASALTGMFDGKMQRLTVGEVVAIKERISFLKDIALLSNFRDARLRKRWLSVLIQLASNTALRRDLRKKAKDKLIRKTR